MTALYRDVDAFPEATVIRKELRAYTTDVIERAWPAMERGESSSVNDAEAERLAHDVGELHPRDVRESNLQQHMLASLSSSLASREQRLTEDATGLNGIMWTVVILGGFITVGFSYLFEFQHSRMQTAMIGTLALLIGLVIFLTMSLDYPFRGSIKVAPDAFERALQTFDAIDRAATPSR